MSNEGETWQQAAQRRARREGQFQAVLGAGWLEETKANNMSIQLAHLDECAKQSCMPEQGRSLGATTHYFPEKDTFGEYGGLLPQNRDAEGWEELMCQAGINGNYFPFLKQEERSDEGRFVVKGILGFEDSLFRGKNERSVLVNAYPNANE